MSRAIRAREICDNCGLGILQAKQLPSQNNKPATSLAGFGLTKVVDLAAGNRRSVVLTVCLLLIRAYNLAPSVGEVNLGDNAD